MNNTVCGFFLLVIGLCAASLALAASDGPQPTDNEFTMPAPRDEPYPGTVELHVDATDLAHRVFHVHEVIPVTGGEITLLYPQWIPGYHSPAGPIDKFAGLVLHAGGRRIPWVRDPAHVYAFHVDLPKGAARLTADFQFLSPHNPEQGRVVMTPAMLELDWNTVALYPAGYFGRDITFRPSLTLPEHFKFATALGIADRSAERVHFEPIDFENLVDSPVFAGKYSKRFDLAPEADTPVHLNVFADAARDLETTPKQIEAHRRLVTQMVKRYGQAQHYDHYEFLLALSDEMSGIGMEHHRSSENVVPPDYFTKWQKKWTMRDLLAHEYNHSWDGKYRRPARLWTPNFNVPMRDHGLWVYEGFTQYSGYVLAERAGLWNKQQALQRLALVGAEYDRGRPGMQWRDIWDTTNDPTIAQRAPLPYRNYQLSEDYYSGGQLIWLAVDAEIRSLTDDKRSLTDWARAFFGGHDGAWDIKTYGFADVVDSLGRVAPYDWTSFLRQRLRGHGDLADAFNAEGWTVVYNARPNPALEAHDEDDDVSSLTYSIGLTVSTGHGSPPGKIRNVLWSGPAFKAGLAPGMTIVAVNGKAFTAEALEHAVENAAHDDEPITLLYKNFDAYDTVTLDYHGGLKYPHLERIEGTTDYLSEVLRPL